METQVYYAIMPYLRTSDQIAVRGITFWPSQDVDTNQELDDDGKRHIRAIVSMFYCRNDTRIRDMTYTQIHVGTDPREAGDVLLRLREARILIAFCYSSPHFPAGDPFLLHEHGDLYLFRPTRVSKYLLGCEDASHAPKPEEHPLLDEVEGYEGVLNFHSYLWVAEVSRIYPSIPAFWLNLSQDLRADLGHLDHRQHQWPLSRLIEAQDSLGEETRQRIFTALDWYNRSCSGQISEEVSLVHLATAFECLFNLQQGPDLTDRFEDAVLLMLGRDPRLSSWVEQFYNARSKVLHQGYWPHLAFYAVDSDAYRSILKGKQEGVVYRSLAAYGRRVFRLCLQTILAGALASGDTGLPSLFVHNQERLAAICRQLKSNNFGPLEKISSIAREVLYLHEYWLDSEETTEVRSVIGAGVLVIKTYLELNQQLPDYVEQSLLAVVNKQQNASGSPQRL